MAIPPTRRRKPRKRTPLSFAGCIGFAVTGVCFALGSGCSTANNTGSGQTVEDGGLFDAPDDTLQDATQDAIQDAPTDAVEDVQDATTDATNDATDGATNTLGDFAGKGGPYQTQGSPGCYINGFTLEVTNGIVVNPLGNNGATTFTLVNGSTSQANASVNMQGLGQANCVLTIASPNLTLACTGNASSCTQMFVYNGP